MIAKQEKINNYTVKVEITVDKEEFAKGLDVSFEKAVKDVKVPGFRPGKLPKKAFISRFGYEPLYEEAINYCMQQAFEEFALTSGLTVIGVNNSELVTEEISVNDGFTFTIETIVMPEIEIGQYKGLTVEVENPQVTDQELDAKIKELLANEVELIIKEEPAENGDIVTIDFEGFLDGVAFEGGKAENYDLKLGSKSFIPGFEDQLIGTVADQAIDVLVTFPENYQAENLAGKEVVFKCLVHEVKKESLPELNDQLIEQLELEGIKTVSEYKDDLIAKIKKEKEERARHETIEKIFEQITVNPEFEVPEMLIDRRCESVIKRVTKQAENYGVDFETFLSWNGITKEQFDQDNRNYTIQQVTREQVTDKIAVLENIELSEEELTEIDVIIEKSPKTPEYRYDNLCAAFITNKVVQFLLAENTVVYK